ncbi:MAG: hypothetical protein DRQ39_02215 [Gammaproteobacteria bacterium]|nr:MAG: hypothetical protein DRQ39_02215 [Gammaproteobacteria bacterium]
MAGEIIVVDDNQTKVETNPPVDTVIQNDTNPTILTSDIQTKITVVETESLPTQIVDEVIRSKISSDLVPEALHIIYPGIPGQNPNDSYTNLVPVPEDLGGVEQGDTFNNQTFSQMFDKLLYPYQYPSFTSFYISGQSSTVEVGDIVVGGFRPFIWATTNTANAPRVDVLYGLNVLATGLVNDGDQSVDIGSDVQLMGVGSATWTINSENTQGGSLSRDYRINWRYANHYGNSVSTVLDESAILGLSSSSLVSGYSGTYSFSAGGGYKYICYPVSFGLYTKATDPDTGFAVAMELPYMVSITNAAGVTADYYVHRTTNIINASLRITLS